MGRCLSVAGQWNQNNSLVDNLCFLWLNVYNCSTDDIYSKAIHIMTEFHTLEDVTEENIQKALIVVFDTTVSNDHFR